MTLRSRRDGPAAVEPAIVPPTRLPMLLGTDNREPASRHGKDWNSNGRVFPRSEAAIA